MNRIFTIIFITIICIFFSLLQNTAKAETDLKSTGIGLRGNYWNFSEDEITNISVSSRHSKTSVNVGGAGGYLYMFSRVNYNMWIELSIGAVGQVKVEDQNWDNNGDENVDVFGITPLLIGLRYDLLSHTNSTALKPYFAFGGGPYWTSLIKVRETDEYDDDVDDVNVTTKLKSGGYLGGGLNFMLCSWCAFNVDMKYHFINFDVNHPHSGFDFGLGFNFMWGRFQN